MPPAEIEQTLQGKPGTKVQFRILRAGASKVLEFEVARGPAEPETMTSRSRARLPFQSRRPGAAAKRSLAMVTFSGVWLPIITPFIDGEIDYAGYEKLIDHYLRAGVAGIIPLGTTGESPTIDEVEAETLVERTVAAVAGRVPVLVGVGANDTRKAVKAVKRLGRQSVQGILSVCPGLAVPALLAHKQVRAVTFTDWKRIDQIEIAAGKKRGKPREKLTTIAELLAAVS